MLNPLLERQLKKNGLDENKLPEQWRNFLERVSRTYNDADQERYLMERSLMISSMEMQDVYEKLRASETRYALAAEGANDGLWDWDLTGRENVYYSPRWCEIMGVAPEKEQIPHKDWWLQKIHPDDYKKVAAELEAHLQGKTKHFQNEHRVLHSSGEYCWVLIRGLAVRDENEKACRIAGSLTDITERKRAEEKLAHDAVHDALTGLPNRKRLIQRLERSVQRAKRSKSYNFAVLFIDLDRFKTVNDSLGHQAGDELLLRISDKLLNLIRPSDMVARLGGDEFVILIENVKEEVRVNRIAERILRDLQKPSKICGQKIYVGASIGITFSSEGYDKPEDLLRDADLAMYRAKVKGKGRYEVFDSKLHSGAVTLLQTEIDLRRAIERSEFVLNYQPIVSLDSEDIVGFESLIRWDHPTRGRVAPDKFISVAEETGLILPIGKWVIRESCRQMREWQEQFAAARSMIINVNLSARQLEQSDLVEQISGILEETGLSPNSLKLEITESVIMSNAEESVETVRALRRMGVRVSIDDFGTGYSSLSYLHRFPINTLKIDRSFVSRIGNADEHAEIIRTIITLAFNLGIDVVAEGVENIEQLTFLRRMNCNFGQGFYYSRPVNSLSAAKMIRNVEKTNFSAVVSPVCEMNLVENVFL